MHPHALVIVRNKPAYVHGLGLQDALYKALHPNASEHEVIAERSRIIVDRSGSSDAPVMYLVTREIGKAAALKEAAMGVIRCSAPPDAWRPEVRIVGPEYAGTLGITDEILARAEDP